MNKLSSFLEVSSSDPDDVRRRKLLNILLAGTAVVALVALIWEPIFRFTQPEDAKNYPVIYPMTLGFLAFEAILYFINRRYSGILASSIFTVILIIAFASSDTLKHVAEGKTVFFFTVPILASSFLIRPYASFVTAIGVSAVLALIATLTGGGPNFIYTLGFLTVALVAWLATRSLENALRDLRLINAELDQRVQDRTRDLAEANRELHTANIDLADANEKLKELDRLKTRFVSMISHELRTPLNAIQGFAEMISAGIYGPTTEKQITSLERITANTQRLLSIVNDLLDQARIEAGQLALHIEPFSPADLVKDLHSTMATMTEHKGLRLTVHLADDLPTTLHGDKMRLHQILVNLVNNAFKFTEEGGIDVYLQRHDPSHWMMAVHDTGPGIPEDALGYIFEAFRQVDGSATRKHQGTGLGLAIVKQLATLMGGAITVESQLGHGTTFTVTLPIIQQEEKHE